MFLNQTRIASAKVSSTAQIVIGGIFAFFWIVGLIAVLSDDPSKRESGSSTFSLVMVDLVMLILPVILILLGISKRINISKAAKLSNIFEGDKDGIVNIKETATLMGMPEHKFMKLFSKLVSGGYIKNASLNNENGLCILLTREGAADPELDYLKCSSCGATTPVRKGYSGVCQSCGSPLKKDKAS